MEIEQNREAALSKLLTEMFDGDSAGLLRWVRSHLGKRIHDELPTSAPLSQLAFDATLAIQRHGLVRQAFASMYEERPGQAGRIQEVARQWGVTVGTGAMREPVIPGDTPTARQATIDVAVPSLPSGDISEPASLPSALRMPMLRNPLFVGRADELRVLAQALQVGNPASIGLAASVTGLGGMGKTQLAAEFVHRYGQFFTGGVFWLGFSEPASIVGQFLQCGGPAHLGLWLSEAAPNIDTQVAMVRTAFAAPVPRLLVFDNCEDEKLLAEWRPATGGCRVLVTCRRHAFSPHLGVHTLALDVLPRAESLALLRSLDRGKPLDAADDAMLDAICAELGDLPLALHLAGSFLARYGAVITPAAYLAQLRSPALLEHPSLQGRGAENSPTNHELHVGKTFALSWDRLDSVSRVDTMARALLQRAACLAPGEPIPHVLLVATLGPAEDDLDATLAQADALHRLLALGLLDAPESGTYRIHRLVMAFVRQTNGDHTAARTAVEHVLLHEAEEVNESGNPARLLPWQPHLRAVTDAALAREDVQAVRLFNALGWHLRTIAKYRDARPYLERALVIREQQLGPEDLNTAQSSNLLALLLQDEGAYDEARPLFERALSIAKQKLGPEHRNSVTSLSNQALLLKAQGAYDEARPLLEQALAIYERQLGPEHLDTATALGNLAGLLHTMGAAAEARPLFERALAIHEKQLGAQHPATARSLDNLAAVLQEQGDHTQARARHERALAIREQQLGPEHPETATSLNNLAGLAHAQRAYAEARPLLERALAIREKLSGPEHLDTAQLVHNLAALLQNQGAYAEARPLFERVLAIREKQLGPEHQETVKSRHYLAALLQDLGAYAEARPLFECVLTIREKQLGPEHQETIRSLHYLAALLHAQGAHADARPLFERVLAAYEKQLGPEHLFTAACLNDLAAVLHAQGAHADARPLFDRALAIREKQLGPDHPDTAKSLNNLAALLHAQGAKAEARPLLERALVIHEKQVGANPLDMAQSLNNLAALLVAQGAQAEARPLLERALAICEKQLGLVHPETLRNLEQLAALLVAQGAHAEARALFERALTICETLLGPDHPSTAVSEYNLGRLLQDQGAHAEARVLYERALAIFEATLRPDHPFTRTVRDTLQNLPGS
jgi:tetratricopeptide (TPR) repeat protein